MACTLRSLLAAALLAGAASLILPAVASTQDKTDKLDKPGKQNKPEKRPGPACQPIAEAVAGQDTCVQAHVYEVVELADGTRFLDVCPPEVPDEGCHFFLVSERGDRDDVGDLRRYRGMDIAVRGTLQPMHGRLGMAISHARQLNGGPPRFKPNPRLIRGFSAASDRMPVRDPNLHASGHTRSFMDTRDKQPLKH